MCIRDRCYASHEMLALDRYVKDIVNKPMISYISDDNYSVKQFRISPIYWGNRFILRHNMRKTFPFYELVYTMTDEQMEEYTQELKCNMKILKKYGEFSERNVKHEVNTPCLLYTSRCV